MNFNEALIILGQLHDAVPRSVSHTMDRKTWERVHDAIGTVLSLEASSEDGRSELRRSLEDAAFLLWWGEHQAAAAYRPSRTMDCANAAWGAWQARAVARPPDAAATLLAEIGLYAVEDVLPPNLVERVRHYFKLEEERNKKP